MPKLIIGFVLGVIVTIVVMQWLEQPEDSWNEPTVDRELPMDDVAEPSPSQSKAAPDARTATPVARGEAPAEDEREPNLDMAEGSAAVTDATAAQNSANPSTGQRPRATNSTAESGVQRATNQNEYPPEIAEMIEKSVDKELQARYENDEREDSWAPYMEGLLAAYLAQKPELAQFYISLIDCRTSICSVHAIGYGPDALTQWTVATADIVNQPWFEFNNMSMNRRNPVPDVLAVVLILTKNPST